MWKTAKIYSIWMRLLQFVVLSVISDWFVPQSTTPQFLSPWIHFLFQFSWKEKEEIIDPDCVWASERPKPPIPINIKSRREGTLCAGISLNRTVVDTSRAGRGLSSSSRNIRVNSSTMESVWRKSLMLLVLAIFTGEVMKSKRGVGFKGSEKAVLLGCELLWECVLLLILV